MSDQLVCSPAKPTSQRLASPTAERPCPSSSFPPTMKSLKVAGRIQELSDDEDYPSQYVLQCTTYLSDLSS